MSKVPFFFLSPNHVRNFILKAALLFLFFNNCEMLSNNLTTFKNAMLSWMHFISIYLFIFLPATNACSCWKMLLMYNWLLLPRVIIYLQPVYFYSTYKRLQTYWCKIIQYTGNPCFSYCTQPATALLQSVVFNKNKEFDMNNFERTFTLRTPWWYENVKFLKFDMNAMFQFCVNVYDNFAFL